MKPRNFFKTTLFAALAAVPLIATTAHTANAQKVASTQFSSPAPKTKSGDQWTFITWKAFGINSATELNGASFCAVTDSPAAKDANEFFKVNDLSATHVKVDNDRAGIEEYQKYGCDALVVANRAASSTVNNLKPANDHVVLPEKFGTAPKAKPAAVRVPQPPKAPPTVKAPAPVKTPPAATQQSKPKPQPKPKTAVRKKRCSAVRYGYTRGNTCACTGGRVFTGNRCVRRRFVRSRGRR